MYEIKLLKEGTAIQVFERELNDLTLKGWEISHLSGTHGAIVILKRGISAAKRYENKEYLKEHFKLDDSDHWMKEGAA